MRFCTNVTWRPPWRNRKNRFQLNLTQNLGGLHIRCGFAMLAKSPCSSMPSSTKAQCEFRGCSRARRPLAWLTSARWLSSSAESETLRVNTLLTQSFSISLYWHKIYGYSGLFRLHSDRRVAKAYVRSHGKDLPPPSGNAGTEKETYCIDCIVCASSSFSNSSWAVQTVQIVPQSL